MTDEQLIEAARVAFTEAWEAERAKIGRGIAEQGTKTRAGIRAAWAVFEEAHAPTGDERVARVLAWYEEKGDWLTPDELYIRGLLTGPKISTDDEREVLVQVIEDLAVEENEFDVIAADGIADAVLAAGFRRSEGLARHIAEAQGESETVPANTEVLSLSGQGESSEAPTLHFAARQGGKSQALIDQMLAQANERGIRVEVVYLQGEPSDAQVGAAMHAVERYYASQGIASQADSVDYQAMRAALRAAGGVR